MTKNTPSPEDVKRAIRARIEVCLALRDAIKELGSIPSGHLYANVCGSIDLQTYTWAIEQIKAAGLIEERTHLLVFVGK